MYFEENLDIDRDFEEEHTTVIINLKLYVKPRTIIISRLYYYDDV
jgi:hypothetical protein